MLVSVAFLYIRFSTPDQIKGDSLRRQIEASSRYAAVHNLTLDETLNVRDLGVSAFKGRNFEEGALRQFMIAVDDGHIAPDSYLIVESLDRLSRLPVTDALAIFQAIIGRGITIVTLTDSAVYSKERLKDNWTPLLMALVTMSRAHEESAVKSMHIKAAWAAKKQRIKAGKEVMTGKRHRPGAPRASTGPPAPVPPPATQAIAAPPHKLRTSAIALPGGDDRETFKIVPRC
jgi:DNA invertase Pin-like site-specific DNA recombinase